MFIKKVSQLIFILLNFCCVHLVLANEPNVSAHKLTDEIEIKKQTHAFERGMELIGAHVKLECSSIIEFFENKDHSFGAFCFIKSGNLSRSIMLCDDTMIGKLTIKAYGFTEAEDELIEFTKTNCPGGG